MPIRFAVAALFLSVPLAIAAPSAADRNGDPLPEGAVARFGNARLLHGNVQHLEFSPDGRLLVSSADDETALVWDMRPLIERASRRPPELDDPRLAAWWAALGRDSMKAGAAMLALEQHPAHAVSFIAARLSPARGPAPDKIARWITALDRNEFARREEATKELGRLAELAEPALREALKNSPSAELKRRAEGLLSRLSAEETDPERLRQLRAVEVLERIGTPEARKVLEALARGAPAAKLTREAKASLERLSSR